MALRIDLNCDLGEGYDVWAPGVRGLDDELLGVVTSANVACGYHAGDARTMAAVCGVAADRGVAVGAHVSYRDTEGFGRRPVAVPAVELRAQVLDQLGALMAVARGAGTSVTYLKPHGALYNVVVHDDEHAGAVVGAVLDSGARLPVVGLPGSVLLRLAREAGLRAVSEAFADRGYRADGTLVPRSEPGALVTGTQEVARRVVRMVVDGVVRSVDGRDVVLVPESVCVHSDTPGAVMLARSVRRALESAGVVLRTFAATGARHA